MVGSLTQGVCVRSLQKKINVSAVTIQHFEMFVMRFPQGLDSLYGASQVQII